MGPGSPLAVARVGQDDNRSVLSTNLRLWETIAGPPCLFPARYLQGMLQLQRVEPVSARGIDVPWAGIGLRAERRRSLGTFWPTKRGGKPAMTIRPGATESALAAQPESSSEHKKNPRRVAPPGVVSSSRHASIKERCRGGRGCAVRSCPDSESGRRQSAWPW
jgi:hypothetical protein